MESKYLQEAFQKTGYKQNYIAERLDIKERTLYNWLNMQGIEHTAKFIELLEICGICPFEFLNVYNKSSKFKCKKCESCVKDK